MIFLSIENGEMTALYGRSAKRKRVIRSMDELVDLMVERDAVSVMCMSSLDWPEKGTPPRVVRLANEIRGNNVDPYTPES